MIMERIPIPRLKGDYVTIYRPAGDVYRGRDTQNFRYGEYYPTWIVNDFSLINHKGVFHMAGITHPKTPTYIDEFNYTGDCHEGEEVLFHATAKGNTLADVLTDGAFEDREKLLYPQERPDEIAFIHSPHLTKKDDDTVRMIYGPKFMRIAETKDFVSFDRRVMFYTEPAGRDPFLYEEDGVYSVFYTVENRVDYVQSTDLINFTEPRPLQENHYCDARWDDRKAGCESPFLFKHNGFYYLFWAIWDARMGCYDHRTFVFGGRTIEELSKSAPITMLPAHAGEIYQDESGIYLLSAYWPENGISAVPLEFVYA